DPELLAPRRRSVPDGRARGARRLPGRAARGAPVRDQPRARDQLRVRGGARRRGRDHRGRARGAVVTAAVRKAALGDFQTPRALADRVCAMLRRRGLRPATVVEPTCGLGTFLLAAAEAFPGARLCGHELDPAHAREARARLAAIGRRDVVRRGDFFATAWADELRRWEPPVLVLGNPPWVTSARLSVLGVDNLPAKSNFKALPGLA